MPLTRPVFFTSLKYEYHWPSQWHTKEASERFSKVSLPDLEISAATLLDSSYCLVETKMGFINISDFQPIEPVPGCRMRTPFGEHLMLSYLEMDDKAEVPMHSHPHEQGGMLLQGTLELTIGDETRLCQPGSMFLIPPNVKHRAVAVGGKCVVLDVFSPVREDYAELVNRYIPPVGTQPKVE